MTNKSGFSLVEVLATIIILGFLMYTVARREIWSLISLGRGKGRIERVYWIKKYLYKMVLDLPSKEKQVKKKEGVKTVEDPDLKISYQLEEINRKSSLHEFKNFVQMASAEGEWQEGGKLHGGPARSIKMISFVLSSPEKRR